MREILFRGKRKDNSEWIEGELAYFFDKKDNPYIMPHCYFATREFNEEDENGQEIISDEIAFGGFISVVHETVGQFTGLTDKKGKKIFEGDKIDFRGIEYIVYWYKMAWHYRHGSFDESMGTPFINTKEKFYSEFEVIGNIHDNN